MSFHDALIRTHAPASLALPDSKYFKQATNMSVVSRFSNSVRRIEHFWIDLKDGTRLAARMWLPEEAESNPVPAILEYIPYRKRDGTRGRDEPMHHYFAGHGYAAIRVDLRGSGESDGFLDDEYTQQELADGSEVIGWIAAQK